MTELRLVQASSRTLSPVAWDVIGGALRDAAAPPAFLDVRFAELPAGFVRGIAAALRTKCVRKLMLTGATLPRDTVRELADGIRDGALQWLGIESLKVRSPYADPASAADPASSVHRLRPIAEAAFEADIQIVY